MTSEAILRMLPTNRHPGNISAFCFPPNLILTMKILPKCNLELNAKEILSVVIASRSRCFPHKQGVTVAGICSEDRHPNVFPSLFQRPMEGTWTKC